MTRRMLAAAALGAVALMAATPAESWAFGGKRKKAADCGGCPEAVAVAHAPAADCGPAAAPAVAYADQVVVSYKPEWKKKQVEVNATEYKWVDEEYTYKACEYVSKKEKVKVCEHKETKEAYKYTVNEWQQVKDKVKVCETEWKEKEEKYSYYEPAYTKQKVKKTVYETVCVPTEVTVPVSAPAPAPCEDGGKRKGLFARLCAKKKKDDCAAPCPAPAPCPTGCDAPCGPAVVTQVVMKATRVAKEVEVEETVCTMVKKEGVRKVKYAEPKWVEKEVTVSKCMPVVKEGTRTVLTPTWVEKEVDVKVPTWVEKKGTHKVCKAFPVKKMVEQAYCEMVKVETVVKVPVSAPAPAPAADCGGCAPAAVAADCGSARKRGGLFSRLCGKKDKCD